MLRSGPRKQPEIKLQLPNDDKLRAIIAKKVFFDNLFIKNQDRTIFYEVSKTLLSLKEIIEDEERMKPKKQSEKYKPIIGNKEKEEFITDLLSLKCNEDTMIKIAPFLRFPNTRISNREVKNILEGKRESNEINNSIYH